MTERNELLIKLALCLLSLVALLWRLRRRGGQRHAGPMFVALAVTAIVVFTNVFTFQYGASSFTHAQEMFHYQLGSKYFPELGYDGLYEASVAAQVESDPGLPLPRRIRDLRTNAIVPPSEILARRADIVGRFSPARWTSFVADHAYFCRKITLDWPDTRIDHPYNPTPTWTFVGRLFNSWRPLNATTVPLLALLDWVLVGAALLAVSRTYGGTVAATFAIVFGLGFPWRYLWVGGAFLRFDWFAAVVIGVCMLKREKFGRAGALFAYATAVRIFPGMLLLGVGVVAARQLLHRQDARWVVRFGGAFVGSLAVCFIAGALTGRGVGAWGEFARNIKKHHDTWSLNMVGLELVVPYSPEINWPAAGYWADIQPTQDAGYVVTVPALGLHARADTPEKALAMFDEAIDRHMVRWRAEMNEVQAERRPLYLLVAGLAAAALILAAWQQPVDEAATLGVVAIFALLCLSCYYSVVLTLLALRRGVVGPFGLLGLNAATLAVALLTPQFNLVYLIFSCGVVVLLVAWLGPHALATVRGKQMFALAPIKATAERGKRRRRRR